MADIELVIKIDEEDYEIMKHNIAVDNPLCPIGEKEMVTKIVNGTLLPKGHGRLGDLDALNNGLREQQRNYEHTSGIRQPINEAVKDGIIIARTHIDYAPTIIEAERSKK